MTTQTVAPSPAATSRRRPTTLLRVGAVLAALLAIADVATAIPFLGDPMPIEVGVAIFVIAGLTLVGAAFAFLGRTWGVWLAAVTRFLAIGGFLPIFIEPGAPAEAAVPGAILMIVTVLTIVVLMVGLARRK